MESKRIQAGIIDFLISATIQVILMLIFIVIPQVNNKINYFDIYSLNLKLTLISVSYLIFRDILGKKSIGKRIIKLKIIDSNSNPASFLKRFLRNITWFFGIIEVIVLIFTKKRIGDRLAGTNIILE